MADESKKINGYFFGLAAIVLLALIYIIIPKKNIFPQNVNSSSNLSNPLETILAAKIVNVRPLDTVYLKKQGDKLILVRDIEGKQRFTFELPSADDFFGKGWNSDQPGGSFTDVSLDLGSNFDEGKETELIWIFVTQSDGGMAPVITRTAYTININSKKLKEDYVLADDPGNSIEGVAGSPTVLTFGQNDLVFDCASDRFISSMELELQKCKKDIQLYKNYDHKEDIIHSGNITETVYYDSNNVPIKPVSFGVKNPNEASLDLSYINQELINASFNGGSSSDRYLDPNAK